MLALLVGDPFDAVPVGTEFVVVGLLVLVAAEVEVVLEVATEGLVACALPTPLLEAVLVVEATAVVSVPGGEPSSAQAMESKTEVQSRSEGTGAMLRMGRVSRSDSGFMPA